MRSQPPRQAFDRGTAVLQKPPAAARANGLFPSLSRRIPVRQYKAGEGGLAARSPSDSHLPGLTTVSRLAGASPSVGSLPSQPSSTSEVSFSAFFEQARPRPVAREGRVAEAQHAGRGGARRWERAASVPGARGEDEWAAGGHARSMHAGQNGGGSPLAHAHGGAFMNGPGSWGVAEQGPHVDTAREALPPGSAGDASEPLLPR